VGGDYRGKIKETAIRRLAGDAVQSLEREKSRVLLLLPEKKKGRLREILKERYEEVPTRPPLHLT